MDYRKSEGIWYENTIAKRLMEAGYTNVRTTPASGDKGADLLWTHPNGTKFVGQCKYYSFDNKVSSDAVSAIHAARSLYGCDQAIIFTSSTLTPQARQMAHALNVHVEEGYNPTVDATRIRSVQPAKSQTKDISRISNRFAELVEFLDYKVLKREDTMILGMDQEGGVNLWQYIDSPVVDKSDVLSLHKKKDFFSDSYGCDAIMITTSGVLTRDAKEKIIELGGYFFENQALDDTAMSIIRQEQVKKVKRDSQKNALINERNSFQGLNPGTRENPFPKKCSQKFVLIAEHMSRRWREFVFVQSVERDF